MLGKEPLGEFGDGRRLSCGPILSAAGSAPSSIMPSSLFASLRAVSGVQGEPCRPIVSLRSGAPRPVPAR